MRKLKIVWGSVLIILSIITFISFIKNFKVAPFFYMANILTLFGWGFYFLVFNKKKDIIFDEGKLVVKRGNKKLKELDLIAKERVIPGYKSIKIVFRDFTESFHYSDFNKDSIEKLKSLV